MKKVYLSLLIALFSGVFETAAAQSATENRAGESRVIVPGQNRSATTNYSGLWGEVSFREVIIEAPAWSLSNSRWMTGWKEGTIWKFPGSVSQFRNTLETARFPPNEIAVLTSPPCLMDRGTHLEVSPPESILLNLPRQRRGFLYSKLSTAGETDLYEVPIQLAPGGVARISDSKSHLPQYLIDDILKLSYTRRTGILYISDLNYLAGKADSDEQRIQLAQFISREPTGIATLNVGMPREKHSEIVTYWSAQGRNTNAETILASALQNPEINSLDISHILPPLPKKLLNTYPDQHSSVGNRSPNCYATALSFFDDELSPQLVEAPAPVISARYAPASRPWQFGDLVVILGGSGEWLHICNYVAGEILFTKNGKNLERPWVLQTMDDVFASYLREDSVTVAFFRLKELSLP